MSGATILYDIILYTVALMQSCTCVENLSARRWLISDFNIFHLWAPAKTSSCTYPHTRIRIRRINIIINIICILYDWRLKHDLGLSSEYLPVYYDVHIIAYAHTHIRITLHMCAYFIMCAISFFFRETRLNPILYTYSITGRNFYCYSSHTGRCGGWLTLRYSHILYTVRMYITI